MRILAVDDDPVVLDLLKASLEQCGHDDAVFVETAEEALIQIGQAAHPFDCFLLDIMLPGIDGVELCARIRARKDYGAVPIIMITASREHNIMERAFGAGATDFVTKPFDGLELGTRINLAAMLSDSLMREKLARHEMANLTALTAIRFEEAFAIRSAPFVVDYEVLKAPLLNKPSCLYSIGLTSVEIETASSVFEATSPAQFRQIVETIGLGVSGLVNPDTTRFAYIGSGRFVALTYGRRGLDREQLRAQLTHMMRTRWDATRLGQPVAPALCVRSITDFNLSTGRAAADRLDRFVEGREQESAPSARLAYETLSQDLRRAD